MSLPVTGGQVEGLVKDQFALRHLTTQSGAGGNRTPPAAPDSGAKLLVRALRRVGTGCAGHREDTPARPRVDGFAC